MAPPRRYWAVVGSGPDRVAAAEVRIKLSELCYKAIACDATEDKKHIDLSSRAADPGVRRRPAGPNADDVAKEVAIYRAHKAAPVVIATDGRGGPLRAPRCEVIEVPAVDPDLAFVLSAMVGHLFGYEAALAIDAQARPLREARAAIEAATAAGGRGPTCSSGWRRCWPRADPRRSSTGCAPGAYNGHLEAATAVGWCRCCATPPGVLPLDGYEIESGKVGVPRRCSSPTSSTP